MIELKERPKVPRGRKIIEHMEIELFPSAKEIQYSDDPDDVDYEEVPSPSLAEIVRYFEEKGINLNDVKPGYYNIYNRESTYYFGPHFYYTIMEPEDEYANRIAKYKKELKEYEIWYKKNKDEIKATKATIKAEKEKIKEEKKLANKKKKLLKQQEKLAIELEKLKE